MFCALRSDLLSASVAILWLCDSSTYKLSSRNGRASKFELVDFKNRTPCENGNWRDRESAADKGSCFSI
jgi:hypothetical protein